MYNKLKKQNGEKFAQTLRDFHNGLLEIPDIDVILCHAECPHSAQAFVAGCRECWTFSGKGGYPALSVRAMPQYSVCFSWMVQPSNYFP